MREDPGHPKTVRSRAAAFGSLRCLPAAAVGPRGPRCFAPPRTMRMPLSEVSMPQAFSSLHKLLFRQREFADALSGSRKDRITEGGDHRRHAGLAAACRKFTAVDKVHVDLKRGVRHSRNLEVVEVALLDAAVRRGNLSCTGQADRHHRSTFHL